MDRVAKFILSVLSKQMRIPPSWKKLLLEACMLLHNLPHYESLLSIERAMWAWHLLHIKSTSLAF